MLDTIWCSFVINMPWKQLKGWSKNKFLNPYENYYHKNYNGISFRYYYNFYRNKIHCPRLWMDFSAATMQNGINILGYNFGKSHFAIKEIETTISKVVGRPISLKDINCISRIDINRDNRCKSEVEKQQLFDFFKKIKGHSGMEQNVYETGVTIGNGDVELKFYFKDQDINLGEEICSYMPKMCRTEFEIKNYRINKYYPEDLNLYTLLTNKRMTESVWNSLLDEFRIGGEICAGDTLRNKAKKVFNNTKRIRNRKFRQLKQINNTNDKIKHRSKTLEQSKDVVKELDEAGVCPYSCEIPIVLRIDLTPKTIKKRVTYYIVVPVMSKQPVRLMGYLDSS